MFTLKTKLHACTLNQVDFNGNIDTHITQKHKKKIICSSFHMIHFSFTCGVEGSTICFYERDNKKRRYTPDELLI